MVSYYAFDNYMPLAMALGLAPYAARVQKSESPRITMRSITTCPWPWPWPWHVHGHGHAMAMAMDMAVVMARVRAMARGM